MKLNIGDRFWSKVDRSVGPISCWIWKACITPNGYGKVWDGDQYSPAHRVAYLLDGGIVTKEKPDVLHKCHEFGFVDNRLCCNPLHLKAGSQSENMRDCVRTRSHRNSRKTHCKKGHEFTADNVRVQLNPRGGRSRRCLICERTFLNSPKQKAYRARWWRKGRLERGRIKKLKKKPKVPYFQKLTPRPAWSPLIAPDLYTGRTNHPLAQPIFHLDGTVFIPLSKAAWRGMYAKIDFDDFELVGKFTWTSWWCRTPGAFHATTTGKHKTIYMSRLLLGLADRNVRVEYLNKDTLDDRRSNLKITAQRWQLRANNKSGHPGINWDKSRGKWMARIQLNGIGKPLGRFLKKEDAIAAYRAACVEMGVEIRA